MSMRSEMFESEGFAIAESAIAPEQVALTETDLDALSLDRAGTRNLLLRSWCSGLVHTLRTHPLIAFLVPEEAVAVQCTLFEKSTNRNWLVPLHQDVHIPVRERIDHPSLSGWSEKQGVLYVQPPIEVLESLVAVRVHIDDCGSVHGPLRVVPGSHLSGRLPDHAIPSLRAARDEHLCVVGRGGALVMKPLLLHASSKATVPNRRRVLHFLFGPKALPLGLSWAYAV
jgi:hypothetical protein